MFETATKSNIGGQDFGLGVWKQTIARCLENVSAMQASQGLP